MPAYFVVPLTIALEIVYFSPEIFLRRDESCSAKIVIEMDRVPPPQRVKDPPNLIRAGSFSLDRLLSHIDPGPAAESEAFVRLIYEQRRIDVSSDRNRKTGR